MDIPLSNLRLRPILKLLQHMDSLNMVVRKL